MPPRDSFAGTLLVAALLCVVCSFCVSAAAVMLRRAQDVNAALDQQINILDATGLAIGEYGIPAKELESRSDRQLERVDQCQIGRHGDGRVHQMTSISTTYDLIEAAQRKDFKRSDRRTRIQSRRAATAESDEGLFRQTSRYGQIQQVVLPVYGKGLWGTLWGYLALKTDLETVQGITFYEHKETPGLGGEVDNPSWKAQWEGLKLFDQNGDPAAEVYKGPAPTTNPYAVDGLSGATITSRGVTNLIRYWVSEDGYAPFLEQLADEIDSGDKTN